MDPVRHHINGSCCFIAGRTMLLRLEPIMETLTTDGSTKPPRLMSATAACMLHRWLYFGVTCMLF
jgi:hypothetical protein